MFGNRPQSSQQSNKEIHMAHAEDIFSKLKEPHISQPWTLEQDTTTYLWINLLYPKQHLIHLLENLNM